MVVLSGSMSGQAEDSLEVGDLALIRRVEPDTLKVGDVVAYMSGGSAVTHRITAIETAEDGSLLFTTKATPTTPRTRRRCQRAALSAFVRAAWPGRETSSSSCAARWGWRSSRGCRLRLCWAGSC